MEKYEKNYKKSCNVKKIKYNGKVYNVDIKALTKFVAQATIAITLAGVAVVSVAGMAVDGYKEYKNLYEVKSEYVQILENNTHRTYNNEGFWYDYNAIAKELLQNTDDIHLQFYCIYDKIGTSREHKLNCMNELIEQINFEISKNPEKYQNFGVHKNFGFYLIDNGFISTDEYEYYYKNILENLSKPKEETKEESSSWKK